MTRVNNSPQPTQAILSSPETQSSYEGERVYFDAEPNRQPFPLYNQADYYSLTRNPRGVCMVISNEVFLGTGLTRQRGVQEDALHTVFTRLGFTVVIHKDLTAEAMQRELKALGTRNFMNDDALVVCILSHGEKGIVLGTDEQQVSLQELTRPFNSGQAPTLAEKPKLFFIELCDGQAHFDHFVSGPGTGSLHHCNRQNSLEKDAGHIDETAPWDLLLSTMLDCKPFQNTSTGSIYTQELCRQLTISAESSENHDILTVLTRVNREVSKGEYMSHKKMPEYKCTLTKKLVLKFVQADCNQV
ncbi:caspase-8-like [Scomber japonicus]|uniref:caspase-8-like n=1 Tax=Scomber japonicus TaxID=13676 RepID=UPI002305B55C|nr:caspase-8-like [Scomber japonicus]